jgi:hypothetical protein
MNMKGRENTIARSRLVRWKLKGPEYYCLDNKETQATKQKSTKSKKDININENRGIENKTYKSSIRDHRKK